MFSNQNIFIVEPETLPKQERNFTIVLFSRDFHKFFQQTLLDSFCWVIPDVFKLQIKFQFLWYHFAIVSVLWGAGLRRFMKLSLREKCPYSEFKCPYSEFSIFEVFLVRIFPHSVRMRVNRDQKNSEYGNFSRSVFLEHYSTMLSIFSIKCDVIQIYLAD